ncbi:suppressor of fused domain protein [Crossiella sp. CA198]|uniref:suppressor of fused domain protein n=1 Tax=Crossiella sp. CA198 TaxID=3455607 RepID=UPI003F8D1FE5
MNLIAHLESRLGPIRHGWRTDPDGGPMPFTIVQCDGGALPGVTTFATVGLSDKHLRSRVSGKGIHQELLISVPSEQADGPFPAMLQQIAAGLLAEDTALLRGDVLGPHGPILPGSLLEAFYAAGPVHHDDDFAVVEPGADGQPFGIVLVWLIPISRGEAEFVASQGWTAFETQLERVQPDLIDPRRTQLIR